MKRWEENKILPNKTFHPQKETEPDLTPFFPFHYPFCKPVIVFFFFLNDILWVSKQLEITSTPHLKLFNTNIKEQCILCIFNIDWIQSAKHMDMAKLKKYIYGETDVLGPFSCRLTPDIVNKQIQLCWWLSWNCFIPCFSEKVLC